MTSASEAERLVEAIDAALRRLARTIEHLDDLDAPSRASGAPRRQVMRALATHLAHVTAALHACGEPEAAMACTRASAPDDTATAAVALVERARRLRIAFAAAHDDVVDGEAIRDELVAMLARIEICHVSLDADYDLPDLPASSVEACARVAEASEQLRAMLPATPRTRPTARRRPGIASPRGRRSS